MQKIILLFEDGQFFSPLCSQVLEQEGFFIKSAKTQNEAFNILDAGVKPVLVLMEMDPAAKPANTEFAKNISNKYNIPVVYMFGNSSHGLMEKHGELFPYGYITGESGKYDIVNAVCMALRLFEEVNSNKEKEINFSEQEIKENIALRKFAEKALKESQARFREMFDDAPVGYHEIDENGIILKINRTELEMLGFDDERELTGKSIFDFIVEQKQAQKELKDKLAGKKNAGTGYRRNYKSKNGKILHVAVSDRVIVDDNGKPVGIRSTIQDISIIKKAEEALIKSENKYRNIFENAQDILFRTDKEGNIVEISPSIKKISGFSVDYLLGKPITEFYVQNGNYIKPIDNFEVSGEINDVEVFVKNRFEKNIVASINAHYYFDESGAPLGIEGTLRDITYRKEIQEELEKRTAELKKLNSTKDRFFSIIAHDLRGPFNGILNLAELLSQQVDVFSKSELTELGQELLKTSANAYKLLEELLEWSNLESGRMPFAPMSINCKSEIEKVISLLTPNAANKKIVLESDVKADDSAFADKKMLQMVLRNLISNAIKFSYEGGVVVISVSGNGTETVFAVKDSGVGMTEENRGRLFKTGEYLSTFGTKNEKGTGLGLVLCKEIVEKHNGQIWVESFPGKGSAFYFSIPGKIS